MASKKKNKTRSSAKSGKKARRRVTKTRLGRKPREKQPARKRVVLKPKVRKGKKAATVSVDEELKRELQGRNLAREGSASSSEDFEGVSRAEQADSESVDELVEEGNLFEAGVVAGVQEADDRDEKETRTRELPEDDVPEEYLDKD